MMSKIIKVVFSKAQGIFKILTFQYLYWYVLIECNI